MVRENLLFKILSGEIEPNTGSISITDKEECQFKTGPL